MRGRDKIQSDYPDADIDVYLVDPDRGKRETGYEMTNARYVGRITSFVKRNFYVNDADSWDIWQRTFDAFIRKVEKENYKATGYLAPLLFMIARRQARRWLAESGRCPPCGGDYVGDLTGPADEHYYRVRELRAAVARGFAGDIEFRPWERLVLTHWWRIVDKEGYEPTPTILTDALFGSVTQVAFGPNFYDARLREALKQAVRQVCNRALTKLRAYLDASGFGPFE